MPSTCLILETRSNTSIFKTQTWFRASPQLKGQVFLQLRCVFFLCRLNVFEQCYRVQPQDNWSVPQPQWCGWKGKRIVNGVSKTLNHIGAQWTELPPDFVRHILGCECLAFHLQELRWASAKGIKRWDSKSPDVGPWRPQNPCNNQEAFLVDSDTGNKASIRPDWLNQLWFIHFIPIISPHETHLINFKLHWF